MTLGPGQSMVRLVKMENVWVSKEEYLSPFVATWELP